MSREHVEGGEVGFRGGKQQPALERKDSGGVPSPEDSSRYKPWPVAGPHTETSEPSLINIHRVIFMDSK